MRSIGKLTDGRQAATLVDYLLTLGIGAKAERSAPAVPVGSTENSAWELWVFDEDRLAQARETLQEFRADPEAEKFTAATRQAEKLRREAVEKEFEIRRKQRVVGRGGSSGGAVRRPVTMTLLVACCFVFLLTDGGQSPSGASLVQSLKISSFGPADGLPEVQAGQWWRLVSPILLHFSWPHLIFNMLCLMSFGTLVEVLRGSVRMVLFVLLFAAAGNYAQFYFEGPGFGGMSGVVYGLFGYIWMKSQFEPESGFTVDPFTVIIVVLWFLLGLLGDASPAGKMANYCHGVGLFLGVLCGYVPTLVRALRRS